MKKAVSLCLVLFLMACVLMGLPMQANATDTGAENGLEVSVLTDRNDYSAGEDIQITVKIHNTNSAPVEGIAVQTLLPKGLELKSGSLNEAGITLAAGQTRTFTVTAVLGDYEPSPETGEYAVAFLWALVLTAAVMGLALMVKKGKTMHLLSLLLCAAMLLSMTPAAFASGADTGSISADKTITVSGGEYTIRAEVTYQIPAETEQTVSPEIAALYGIDPSEVDSDEDGLDNYAEIYVTGTHPALADTDGDGTGDALEDADTDGITNADELLRGTDPVKADTDNDGIADLTEITELKTDPCRYDTDGDGLSDHDELLLGLDPLAQYTDGETLDAARTFTQKLDDKNIDEQLKVSENAAVPSLTLTTSGNINRRVSVAAAVSHAFNDSRAVIGKPVEVRGEKIGHGTITFTLNTAAAADINTRTICKFNADGSTEYLDTHFNAAENTLTADISGVGTYYVVDVKTMFDEMGFAMNGASAQKQARSISTFSTATTTEAMAQADIVFIIDSTGSMEDSINLVKNNVESFVDALKAKGVSAALALVDYQDITADGYDSTTVHQIGGSNWFYDLAAYKSAISGLELGHGGDAPECVVDALETGRLLDMRASAGKIFILVTDAGFKVDNRYGIPSMEAQIELLKNAGIHCAVVSPSAEKTTYSDLYTQTGGVWANIYGDFYTELMTLADQIGDEVVGDGYWIYLDGPVPVPVRLDAQPKAGSTVDTDGDGILDVYELEGPEPTGSIDLDALLTEVSQGTITGTNYGTVMTYKYRSSPVEVDTDYDGIADDADTAPKDNTFAGTLTYNSNGDTCNVEFTVDYSLLFGDNTVYQKDLSVFSIIYASEMYSDVSLALTSGVTGGDGKPATFGKLFGLEDVEDIKIKAANYSVDKDDLTEFAVGHRTVYYQGYEKEVIVLAVRGTNASNAEWSSNFDVGADTPEYYAAMGDSHPDWVNKKNHKGFDVAMNRVLTKFYDYVERHGLDDLARDKAILITGHSRGAAIANLLGAHFEDSADYESFTYTFASPYCTTDENAADYKTIFNVANEDDLIAYLPLEVWGFKKYGITKSISVVDTYEDEDMFADAEGSFEWLTGADYNGNGGVANALTAFAELATNRDDLYVLDLTDDGTVNIGNVNNFSQSAAEERMAEVQALMDEAKLSRFVSLSVIKKGFWYEAVVTYTPAYLMQNLANMASGVGPTTGYDTRGKYQTAKNAFISCFIDGMTHPHMQPTYYLIAMNDFQPIF